ncbi:MAG: response regulator [Flavobacteriales bacterium]|nr:response regulator [Flavobacteriales bacterium]
MNMLLVDDESEICLLLQAMLAQYGISSSSAHTLAEARQNLASGEYDGVFLDVNLPDGKGHELIPLLKNAYPDIRVIVISAMDQERTVAMAAGADLFLPKPFDRHTILGSLRQVGLVH